MPILNRGKESSLRGVAGLIHRFRSSHPARDLPALAKTHLPEVSFIVRAVRPRKIKEIEASGGRAKSVRAQIRQRRALARRGLSRTAMRRISATTLLGSIRSAAMRA